MDDTNLLRKLGRVSAPPDFERRVMAQLIQRRADLPKVRKLQTFRLSLAGAAAALLVCFLVLNVFVFQKYGPARMAGRDANEVLSPNDFMLITEAVDYGSEIRGASYEPQTVYILEQISNASNTLIKY